MTAGEEAGIIRRVLDGDHNAFEALVLDNQDNVYNLALKMTYSEEDALDISQEAFLRAYRQLAGFRGESRFSVWLYRLTYNLCIDFLRKRKLTAAVSITYGDDADDNCDIEIPDLRELPEDSVLRKEMKESIAESINELSPQHREIIVLREINGMSYTDLARTLDVSEGTVKSRLARARASLAGILLGKGTFPDNVRHNGIVNREEAERHG